MTPDLVTRCYPVDDVLQVSHHLFLPEVRGERLRPLRQQLEDLRPELPHLGHIQGYLVQLLLFDAQLADPGQEIRWSYEEPGAEQEGEDVGFLGVVISGGDQVLDEGVQRGGGQQGPLGKFGARTGAGTFPLGVLARDQVGAKAAGSEHSAGAQSLGHSSQFYTHIVLAVPSDDLSVNSLKIMGVSNPENGGQTRPNAKKNVYPRGFTDRHCIQAQASKQ